MVNQTPQSAPGNAAPKRKRRWLVWALLAPELLLALLLGGLWAWSGSEGSLAQALRWGLRHLPPGALQVDELRGSLRHGGDARRIRWSLDGLTVDVQDARLRWSLPALLAGRLQVDELTAGAVHVEGQSAPADGPRASGPPPHLDWPLSVAVEHFAVGKLELARPIPALRIVGSYRFTRQTATHQVMLDGAHAFGGDWRARLELHGADDPTLHAELSGAALPAAIHPALQSAAPQPVAVQAVIDGPLRELRATAKLGALGGPPQASLHARITPWGATPLPEAGAALERLDLAHWWPAAPATELSGPIELASGARAAWTLQADLRNANSGPWDAQRVPLEQMRAALLWDGSTATVKECAATLAGGTLALQGSWSNPPQTQTSQGVAATQSGASQASWQLRGEFTGIDPARLHSVLAPFPLDGRAALSGSGQAIEFDAALQTPPHPAGPGATAQTQAQQLAGQLHALRLQDAAAKGRWRPGLLTLDTLRVRAADAQLSGDGLQTTLAAPAQVQGRLQLHAPGVTLKVNGQAAQTSGGGTLQADIHDLAQTLAWAQRLPGVPPLFARAAASGALRLQGRWQDGWADPDVHAELNVPRLRWQAAAGNAIELRQTSLTLAGKLSQASLQARVHGVQGARRASLIVQASGGRAPLARLREKGRGEGRPEAGGRNISLAPSTPSPYPLSQGGEEKQDWHATLEQFTLALSDPALGQGAWRMSAHQPVPLLFTPPAGGSGLGLDIGAGELLLSAPDSQQAHIAWEPLRYQDGQLSTKGRITGLPLVWAARLAGPRLAETLGGDLMLEGRWDADLSKTPHLHAELARAGGDLRIASGANAQTPAGIRRARLALDSQGQDLTLHLDWDSEHAGFAQGELRTRLAATPDAEGRTRWSWPPDAPLQGRLQARLPAIEVWSPALAPPGWRLRGALAADLRAGGTRDAPRLDGALSASDLALRSVADGIEFTGGRLRASLSESRLVIDEFTLHGSPPRASAKDKDSAGQDGGTLRASGQAELTGGQVRASLALRLDHLRAGMRADRNATLSGTVDAGMNGRQASIAGQVRVDQAEIALPENDAPALDADVFIHGGLTAAAALPQPTAAPMPLELNLGIDLGERFHVQGQGVDTRLTGKLQLSGSGPAGAMPRAVGVIDASGGTFHAYSQQLRIARGKLLFDGPIGNPRLDILALKPNYQSDQQVGVLVGGAALLPSVRLYAQPDLPDTEKLAWLILGRPAPGTGAEAAMLQQAALAMLGGREGKSMAAHLGLDQLALSGSSGEDATLTVGKRLSSRLYTTYEHSLANALGSLFIYYELSQRWLLRGQAGANAAVDLIYTLSFD
ncbi:MAG: translocation/assembly module TamB domain-containing protein [Burkholderiaceae bacterium]|nr:translocation/assembly module TamB domain-containing protein [Burkholderiaceae bacterium]